MNDSVIDSEREQSLRTVGNISYLLHTIVAVGAVIPGVQASVLLLLVAFVLDLVKKGEAAGTWQESHFGWRIRTVLWAAGAVPRDRAAVAAAARAGLDRLGRDLDLVPLSRRARLDEPERRHSRCLP